ncbi:MAG: hypothetical protein LCI00_01605 [Chloroflexi bacterium]|nr:hypothetical protein [Chloroflexota bacterium]MCC6895612.1 hypothetical protein [Anaerolineae bacterium]
MKVLDEEVSMGKRPLVAIAIILLVIAACSPERSALNNGPLLVQEVTLAPTTPAPTRVLSATPSPIVLEVSTVELGTPITTSTVRANFVLVTPTLPPSKTPTHTPTITPTATLTPTSRPTQAVTNNGVVYITAAPIGGQPAGVVPIPTALGLPPAQVCSTPWFFTMLQPVSCAMNPPLASAGSFLQFQNGAMLWIEKQDAIYVFYDSVNSPRWQVFNDKFVEGMADIDPAFNNPPPFTWQPRRGFGLLWRNETGLRDRLGWAVTEAEIPFTPQVQLGSDGMIFISDMRGGVYSLTPDSSDWKRYS